MLTFGDAERLWPQFVQPALPQFRTMQDNWDRGGAKTAAELDAAAPQPAPAPAKVEPGR